MSIWSGCVIMERVCHYGEGVSLWRGCVIMERVCHYGEGVSLCRGVVVQASIERVCCHLVRPMAATAG